LIYKNVLISSESESTYNRLIRQQLKFCDVVPKQDDKKWTNCLLSMLTVFADL